MSLCRVLSTFPDNYWVLMTSCWLLRRQQGHLTRLWKDSATTQLAANSRHSQFAPQTVTTTDWLGVVCPTGWPPAGPPVPRTCPATHSRRMVGLVSRHPALTPLAGPGAPVCPLCPVSCVPTLGPVSCLAPPPPQLSGDILLSSPVSLPSLNAESNHEAWIASWRHIFCWSKYVMVKFWHCETCTASCWM